MSVVSRRGLQTAAATGLLAGCASKRPTGPAPFTGRASVSILKAADYGEDLTKLSASSKLNAEWAFLTHLRDLGRSDTEAWLQQNSAALGQRSTMPFDELQGPKRLQGRKIARSGR